MTDRQHRSAITGEFVTAEYAEANPDTTVSESRDDLAAELRRLRGVNHNLQVALYGANVKIVELEANLDHLRTEDIPVIQQRRDELIARVAELEGLVGAESGEPIVRTVGDLTARHIGKRVRVGDGAGAIEGRLLNIEHDKRTTDVAIAEGDQDWVDWWSAGPRDTPCEVLG